MKQCDIDEAVRRITIKLRFLYGKPKSCLLKPSVVVRKQTMTIPSKPVTMPPFKRAIANYQTPKLNDTTTRNVAILASTVGQSKPVSQPKPISQPKLVEPKPDTIPPFKRSINYQTPRLNDTTARNVAILASTVGQPKPVSQPKPVEPKPVEPKPVEPKPVEPKPVEPKPVEPKPVPAIEDTRRYNFLNSTSNAFTSNVINAIDFYIKEDRNNINDEFLKQVQTETDKERLKLIRDFETLLEHLESKNLQYDDIFKNTENSIKDLKDFEEALKKKYEEIRTIILHNKNSKNNETNQALKEVEEVEEDEFFDTSEE